jgi:hypothetical protein
VTDTDKFALGVEALRDKHPICVIECHWETVTSLIGGLQLALRHPGMPAATGRRLRAVVDNLIERVAEISPDLGALLHLGDDPSRDVPIPTRPAAADPVMLETPTLQLLRQHRELRDDQPYCMVILPWTQAYALAILGLYCVGAEDFAREIQAAAAAAANTIIGQIPAEFGLIVDMVNEGRQVALPE